MSAALFAMRDSLPEEIRPLISYEPVEHCEIKGVTHLSRIACILRQVANRMQRTINNHHSNGRGGSKRITRPQYQKCEKCGMWLSDEDYVAIRQGLRSNLTAQVRTEAEA